MAYRDLREFVETLEREGELRWVKAEVDWNLEAGAITRKVMDLKEAAPLFEKIKGYPAGFRLLGALFGPTKPVIQGRFALAMGLPKDTPTIKIIEELTERLGERVKPVLVSSAPCQENVIEGDEIDLLKLPVPLIHGTDGGRFLGTWHIDVTKDPDTGWVNWGTYRHMVLDADTLGFLASPMQHGPSVYYQKYEPRGEPMPMAIAIGTDPVCNIVASSPLPAYVDEAEVGGAIRQQPIELVKCASCDLEVPAGAEIVIEGEVVKERRREGPFAEYTGYATGGTESPVFKVKQITHRDAPILVFANPGKPWNEEGVSDSIVLSAVLAGELKKAGVPFRSLYVPPHNLAVIVSARPPYPGFVHTLACALWGSKAGSLRPYIIVVGDDVDITNADEVFWCLTSRLHPINGIHAQKGTPGLPLWPFLTPEEKRVRKGTRLLLDATFPAEWDRKEVPVPVDFESGWPADIKEKILARWKEYGY